MHESELLLTLTASLAAALALGFITQRLGLSPIVGYLLAGVIVGPYTPGFVADRVLANELAEIGIILLMFGVGLHFHLKDLLAVRRVAITGALCQSAVATGLGFLAAREFGWSWTAGLVFGLALSVASTVVLIRVLVDNNHLQTPTGRIAVGWLVVEDIFTIIVLVLLPAAFSTTPNENAGIVSALLSTFAKLGLLGAFVFLVGGRLIPRVLSGVARTHSRELFTLTVLVLALGIAVGSAMVFGVSMALGAFLAGMIVGQSEFSLRAASEALPMRDAFAVLFFVSVGMLFDPSALLASPLLLLATLAIVLLGKPLAAFVIVVLLGYGSKIAFGVAVALAQIGEFSLILATVATQLTILSSEATNLIVAASILSITLNPLLYRTLPWLERTIAKSANLWRVFNRAPRPSGDVVPDQAKGAYRAVVVGYGPIGKTVSRLLRDGGIDPVIIETNLETTRRVRDAGYQVIYGDAGQAGILEAAGIQDAISLVVTGPAPEQSAEIIRVARAVNPNLRVLARSYYLSDSAAMRKAGANEVFSGEGEIALAMTEYVMNLLGATPEQMDRERERVREEVFRFDTEAAPGRRVS
jgi:CPA2 family monovalent cation:H+ antiporter-2